MQVENPMRPMSGGLPNTVVRKTGISWVTYAVTILVVASIAFAVGTRYDNFLATTGGGALDFSEINNIYKELRDNFDGDLDTATLVEGAKRGFVAAAGDAYTQYFSPAEAREFLNDLEGSFEGIGVELGTRNGRLTVVSVIDGSPAKEAGLRSGDIIGRVNDQDSIAWLPEKAVSVIRGQKGTTVKLTIVRDDQSLDFTITRDKVTDPSVKTEIVDGVGYMRISRFSDSDTAVLARKGAQQFRDAGVRGVILDLRGNGGGYVEAAKDVVSLWLSSGQVIVVEKQEKADRILDTVKSRGTDTLSSVPTVVLIDEGSASASEIVAGALRDHNAAVLVGQKSYGKGSVQVMRELPSGAQLKITTARWYTPNGRNISHEGIKPDVEVEMTVESYNNGDDTQRTEATRILTK